ncbi:hypothetical protein RchiOBHm_Chr4g0407671 [Rosa chinensis]|uniref:Uncharacterized protein n=1 Tax=Rosa chinensis TaxID=74649 RepID=A0A2P6QUR4_ROSCH|nr:hypothetical protein RchiOBHm_Chr4g0407671 [Rosa chinensis]
MSPWYSYCSSRGGMPFLHSTLFNNYLALFQSKSSKPSNSTNTQIRKLVRDPPIPRVTNLEEDDMPERRPPPWPVRFAQLSKLKQCSVVVISLFKQMGLVGIGHDASALTKGF